MNRKHVFPGEDEMFKAAAEQLVILANKAINKKGSFTIALSGGNTPKKFYELLATTAYSRQINWKQVFVFWGDERCVPAAHPDNNSHMAMEALLNKVAIPRENVFPIPVNFEPFVAAKSYEETILTFFKSPLPSFDLVLLGIGEDGHTASLFPGTPIVDERTRLVSEVFVKAVQAWRISFTTKLINQAAHVMFLVTGSGKRTIIQKIFSKSATGSDYPALLIQPAHGADWYLDQPAAPGLKT